MLAGSMSAIAQAAPEANKTLAPVTVKEKAEAPEGKDTLKVERTTIGKGNQLLRDIPQSITVITEKLIDDRNFDTVKDVLRNSGGISFQAAEGGEEDIKLRGFSLQGSGDVFVDGIRDPAFYERDTFNNDRVEILRGSAALLFGRGSTGGAVNQVNKQPLLVDQNEVDFTLGSHDYRRLTGDFNLKTGESSALRLNAMTNTADNNGAGSRINKRGIAGAYRFGIGEVDEFSVGFYQLENRNGINYGIRWIKPTSASPTSTSQLNGNLDPDAYYGMASDYNHGRATYGTLSHVHRFSSDTELKSTIRKGRYSRDQRATLWNFAGAASQPGGQAIGLNNFGPGTVLTRSAQNKVQDMDNLYGQSDLSSKFEALGYKHELLAGLDYAHEERKVYGAQTLTTAQTAALTRPNTTIGTPDDGASIPEGTRPFGMTQNYRSNGVGIYAQDLVQIAPKWKLLGGLRFDRMQADYYQFNANTGAGTSAYSMNIAKWSKRAGVLYQPTDLASFHFAYGTSFNTSGDAYSLGATNASVPPEESQNLELGTRIESADKRFSTRLALFRTTKLHERNTDPLIPIQVLSGKRHAQGIDLDFSGRITPQWEVFGSYAWIPVARIDVAAEGAEGLGQRPSLTPKYSGTVWTTYQITPQIRIGGGLNFKGKQQPNRNPGFFSPSYVTADLLAEYTVIEDKFIIKANVTNVANKLYGDALYTSFYVPGAGRELQITAKIKF
ncbi:TonB-dependent siderophore receptor [Rhodoferax koreense]|uniref:TonB-dependent siderophore receptor n=2 Tax=Rhodoferax koreensis TaxID=1842727 RepID=A0A1P8K473_9BURK|nr:TonB-dependent siderophore receptor [Rhodoferax koreense]